MENNLLKVRMFGGFSLEFNDKEVVLDRNAVSKTMQLLQLILLHSQDGGISKAALIEALYGRAEVENKNGSLNNTIFRLRKQLQKQVFRRATIFRSMQECAVGMKMFLFL